MYVTITKNNQLRDSSLCMVFVGLNLSTPSTSSKKSSIADNQTIVIDNGKLLIYFYTVHDVITI